MESLLTKRISGWQLKSWDGTVMTENEVKPMRRFFGEHLLMLGKSNTDLVVLDADVSCSTQTCLFAERYPNRFINCGIAEANMVFVAAGIAVTGLRPVVSTFAFLLATRASDQIRSQIAYSRLPVVFAGSYSGLSPFADGGSHQSVIDLAVFTSMPNMIVLCPGDATETELALESALEQNSPVYIRLSRDMVGRMPYENKFVIGKALLRHEGNDVALISTGQMLETALQAVELLEQKGIQPMLIDLHTVKPLDTETILSAARDCGAIVTCEENSVIGGMGSLVSDFLCSTLPTPIHMIGIQDSFGQSGSYGALRRHYGLTAESIVQAACGLISAKGRKAAL